MSPSLFQKKVWFNALTAICIAVIGGLCVGGLWLTGEVLAYLQPVLVPLAVAGILAYLIDPIVCWLEKKMSRMKAIIIVFVVGFLSLVGFIAMVAEPLTEQIKTLNANKQIYVEKADEMFSNIGKIDGLVESLPEPLQGVFGREEESLESKALPIPVTNNQGADSSEVVSPSILKAFEEEMEKQVGASIVDKSEVSSVAGASQTENKIDWVEVLSVDSLIESLEVNAPGLAKRVIDTITRGASKFFGIVGYALGFIMVPIYLFFFLKDSVKIQKNWTIFIPLRASEFKDEVVEVLGKINDYLIAFFRGQVIVSLIDGVLVGLVLKLLGHPFAILLGIALALLGIIPFIGNLICLVPAAVTAYAHFSIAENQYWIGDNPWMYVIMVVSVFILLQQINSLVTAPKIVGDSVGLHPMTVIFSMIFWSLLLGGFLGALLAVPLTASVKVLFSRYVWERKLMSDDTASASS